MSSFFVDKMYDNILWTENQTKNWRTNIDNIRDKSKFIEDIFMNKYKNITYFEMK